MFRIDKRTKTIYCTRGDRVTIKLKCKYGFNDGDKIKFSIVDKNNYNNVLLQKMFVITGNVEETYLTFTEEDTRFYDVISKEKLFWYEIEYNGNQTVIGYENYIDSEDEEDVQYRAMEFVLLPEAPEKEEE